jgi:hypothetical protein
MSKAKGKAKEDRARNMAEEALSRAAEGKTEEGKRLAARARKLDAEAVDEVAKEVEAESRAAGGKNRKSSRT